MAQNYKLLVSDDAAKDLEEISEYISEELKNPSATANFLSKLYKALQNVCLFPESCPKIANNHVKNPDLRKLLVDNYIAFYEIRDKERQIVLIRILFGMQNYFDIL